VHLCKEQSIGKIRQREVQVGLDRNEFAEELSRGLRLACRPQWAVVLAKHSQGMMINERSLVDGSCTHTA